VAKSAAPSVPAHLEVMRGWLGTKEIPGPKANPIIAGTPQSWSALVDRPDVTSDEVANCAMAGGAALVAAEFFKAGYELKDLIKGGPSAIAILAEHGIFVPLPPKDQRLLARSYTSYGTDARKNPRPGDIMILPREVSWQGHFVFLDTDLGGGKWKCIGANQRDTTSYAEHDISEAVAIRRYVAPTIKDLRAAGSKAIQRADQQQAAGLALGVGVPTATIAGKAIEAANAAQPVTDAAVSLPQIADQTTAVHTMTTTGVALGNVFVENPWIVGCMLAGGFVFWLGFTAKGKRVKDYIANAMLSQHQPA
jgi:hypothetical protein